MSKEFINLRFGITSSSRKDNSERVSYFTEKVRKDFPYFNRFINNDLINKADGREILTTNAISTRDLKELIDNGLVDVFRLTYLTKHQNFYTD